LEVIEKFRSNLNIISIKLDKNYGLAYALNFGIQYCDNELIARMDSDDVCQHDRFEKQLKFMNSHPEISVCGGFIEECNDRMDRVLSVRHLPLTNAQIVKFAKSRSPLSHVTVMYRKSAILLVGCYPLIYPEDYPLWGLFALNGLQMANLPEVLVRVRAGDGFFARRGFNIFLGEFRVFKFLNRIGFLSRYEFTRNVFIRIFVRLSPAFIRKILYKYAR
jgi:glycosyltransferase involved in cell wall biosynthesis